MMPRLRLAAIGSALTAAVVSLALALPVTSATASPAAKVSPQHNLTAQDGLSNPTEDPTYPELSNPEFDALKYNLDLNWDGKTLNGVATIDMRVARDSQILGLDLSDTLKISKLTVDGKDTDYTRSGFNLTIKTGQVAKDSRHKIVITYGGAPKTWRGPSSRDDLATLGWWTAPDGKVYCQQEPGGAFTWYPVNDHFSDKALYDATITTNSGVVGVFNGKQLSQEKKGNKTVARYTMAEPAAPYQITIAIDDYQPYKFKMTDGKEFVIWHTSADKENLSKWESWFKKAYQQLVRDAGPYAYETGGLVVVNHGSAMETATMMTMSRQMMNQEGEYLIEHEFGHHWFGDAVTPQNFRDNWIKEGFTTYNDGVYRDRKDPSVGADRTCETYTRTAGPAGEPFKNHYAENNVYNCPLPIIQQVRNDLGDSAFFEKIYKGLIKDFKHSNIDRAQFTTWLKNKTGKDYSSIMNKYLGTATNPTTTVPTQPTTKPTSAKPTSTKPEKNELSNGKPVSFALKVNEQQKYVANVPQGVSSLKIQITGDGDADLYVSAKGEASDNQYDCRPWLSDSNETCDFSSVKAGTYYVTVMGAEAATKVNLVATWVK